MQLSSAVSVQLRCTYTRGFITMQEEGLNAVEDLLGASYCRVAKEALNSQRILFNKLLTQRRLPDEGWTSLQLQQLLLQLAAADANNLQQQASVGLRSGDIFALQPKAVGSSLAAVSCLPLPLATGMSLNALESLGDDVLCVVSTTSAFAPRQPDRIPEIAQLCKKKDVFHLVNNAYGLQCSKCCSLIEQGCRVGRVDLIVSSTDKNFMTPVGGALVYGPERSLVSRVSACYPGRASISPIIDLFITLLQMGRSGLEDLLQQRKRHFLWFKQQLKQLTETLGLRLLPCEDNKISVAVDLSPLADKQKGEGVSFLGSQLYYRRCSGLRVVCPSEKSVVVGGVEFVSFGSHCKFKHPYCSLACAIGTQQQQQQQQQEQQQQQQQ
ncbi:soluble liver antigen/liver pancreas antigen domain-containing protein, putative [Eimeria acervulina]|uniref:O-phosphoseryl-tRNA(Sec) selenium transferase n=1 Tax=Eimeria acervulina TaxID=5801 RepID=U6GA97_EIMAC|nr:soluble liver antigen/liver pancreas antigen domain-containing protein, putative [Eimeria acervulina]CDI76467.1 soluble liver antigen/liver pancreas antigen domain-containing protein, putative [Eimeria acervulina]